MAEFRSWRSYRTFESLVKAGPRFSLKPAAEAFLELLVATANDRIERVQQGTSLWRAQVGSDPTAFDGSGIFLDDPGPLHPARMKPVPGRVPEGRANPGGIAYLYLAKCRDTAIAEVRPAVGSYVSIGRFTVSRELCLVRCSSIVRAHHSYLEEPTDPAQRERAVWSDIDNAFAAPVTRDDDLVAYVPTQVIAERLRMSGHDGLIYRSSLGEDDNVVLFDLDSAELAACEAVKVTSVVVTTDTVGNGYEV